MASLSKHLSVSRQIQRINKGLNGVVSLTSDAVKDTLFTQAALVASEIRSVAPVGPDSDNPGALRDSVRVEEGSATGKKAAVVKIKAGGIKTTDGGSKPFDYARAIEFGTEKMAAKPFFFPIWRARRKGVRAVVRRAIKSAVRGVFK